MRGLGAPGCALPAADPHGVRGGAAERQPEVGVTRLDGADRVGDEIVVVDVVELCRVASRPHGREAFEAVGPQLQLVAPDHFAPERGRPASGGLLGEAADGGDSGPGRAVRLDHECVRIDTEQGVQCEQVAGVLEHPAPAGVGQADQLQVAPVPAVGVRPVLAAQPRRVGRHVRQAFVGDGPH